VDLSSLLLLLGTGAFAGLLGGLFGIGGGVVIVPVLYAVFGAMDVSEAVRIKLAVGTSLATIVVTSARSLRAHHAAGRVEWPLLLRWAPFIAGGAAAGALLARVVSADVLTLVFALGILVIAVQRGLFGRDEARAEANLPPLSVQWTLAVGTGLASALMGIGGGVFGVLLLTAFGRSVHVAVATAAGFGLAIAVPGALGFALAGQGVGQGAGLPWGTVGLVSLPAFAAVAAASALTAPLGARLAHGLPARVLNRTFGAYLLVTGGLLLREAL
jgi:uncharacterized membrane protein YfcA